MTIPELLTAMSILAIVMTGILVVFVGGLHATTDMNERFQAQQDARLALTSMRTDIRSACSATIGAVAGTPTRPSGSMLTLAEPSPTSGCTTTSSVTWCADSSTGSRPFVLYRQTGSTCAFNSGMSKARSLTTNVIFPSPPACIPGAVVRQQVVVTLPVDANLSNTTGAYTLGDTITLRNAQAAAQC